MGFGVALAAGPLHVEIGKTDWQGSPDSELPVRQPVLDLGSPCTSLPRMVSGRPLWTVHQIPPGMEAQDREDDGPRIRLISPY